MLVRHYFNRGEVNHPDVSIKNRPILMWHLYSTNSTICPLWTLQLNPYRLQLLHQLLQQAGLNQSDDASHSFRIGAATTAAVPTWLIMKLGSWTINAYRCYIYCPEFTTSTITKIFLAQMLQINLHGTQTQ